jgi:Histidine phosphatase superfamily (branch 1)
LSNTQLHHTQIIILVAPSLQRTHTVVVIVTPESLLSLVVQRAKRGEQTALIVRHAEREPIFDTASHRNAVLTQRGHDAARATGARLRSLLGELDVELWHSPIHRCGQTAAGIFEGLNGRATLHGIEDGLGTPYILDDEGFSSACNEHGRHFLRAWFDGRVSKQWCVPIEHAAPHQHNTVADLLVRSKAPVVIGVTHDLNVALVREHHLGHRHDDQWPRFLDGYAFSANGPAAPSEAE